ncbi:MAG: hypothetical protein ACTSPU_15660 [Promethearchaeota archaeon]
MKYKKTIFGVISLMTIFLIPFGQCAETKTARLSNFGDYVGVSLEVIEGDIVRGDYRTYSSPFLVGVGFEYLGEAQTFTNYYETGWFEITIASGSGIIDIVLMNADLYDGGYIEYTVSNPKAEERLMTTIIIGVVIGIISIGVIAGIAVHFNNKKRESSENISPQESTTSDSITESEKMQLKKNDLVEIKDDN